MEVRKLMSNQSELEERATSMSCEQSRLESIQAAKDVEMKKQKEILKHQDEIVKTVRYQNL